MLLDTHFHLDFLPDEARAPFVRDLADRGIGIIAQTLLPTDFLAQFPGPAPLALGFHPWQATDTALIDAQLAAFATALPRTRLIGEIGLDFSHRRLESAPQELQLHALREILSKLKEKPAPTPYVLSIHAVRAAGAVLAELKRSQPPAAPIFHWFSGTSDELTEIRDLGGYISVNPRMLETKRGRAYLRQFPLKQILLETDLPTGPGQTPSEVAEAVDRGLDRVVEALTDLKKSPDVREHLEENQNRLFGNGQP